MLNCILYTKLEMHTVVIIISSNNFSSENGKYYPQVCLDEWLCKLAKYIVSCKFIDKKLCHYHKMLYNRRNCY